MDNRSPAQIFAIMAGGEDGKIEMEKEESNRWRWKGSRAAFLSFFYSYDGFEHVFLTFYWCVIDIYKKTALLYIYSSWKIV